MHGALHLHSEDMCKTGIWNCFQVKLGPRTYCATIKNFLIWFFMTKFAIALFLYLIFQTELLWVLPRQIRSHIPQLRNGPTHPWSILCQEVLMYHCFILWKCLLFYLNNLSHIKLGFDVSLIPQYIRFTQEFPTPPGFYLCLKDALMWVLVFGRRKNTLCLLWIHHTWSISCFWCQGCLHVSSQFNHPCLHFFLITKKKGEKLSRLVIKTSGKTLCV